MSIVSVNGIVPTTEGATSLYIDKDDYVIAGDKAGYIYVLDLQGNLVTEFNTGTNRVNTNIFTADNKIVSVMDGAVRKYEFDANNDLNQIATYTGVSGLGRGGDSNGEDFYVTDSNGNIIKLDSGLNEVWKYNIGNTDLLRNVAYNPFYKVLVTGTQGSGRLAVIRDNGETFTEVINQDLLSGFGNAEWINEDEFIVVEFGGTSSSSGNTVKKYVYDDSEGTITETWSIGNFGALIGMSYTRNKDIYVGDWFNNDLIKIRENAEGTNASVQDTFSISESGGFGSGLHQISAKRDSTVLYVALYSEEVKMFDISEGNLNSVSWTSTAMRDEVTEVNIKYDKISVFKEVFK